MERRIPLIASALLLLILLPLQLPAQTTETDPTLRIELWVPFDEFPGLSVSPADDEDEWMPSVRAMHQLAPYIFSGMIYGWDFSYTPSDKTRQVSEYFEAIPRGTIELPDPRLTFHDSIRTDIRITTEAEYERTPYMMQNRKHWQSLTTIKVTGKGSASVSGGTEAMQSVVEDAIKNGVRAWAQTYTKNKPKEIAGSIILADETPKIGIRNGQYVAELDFFLYVVTINQYSLY